jgi:hypothetical protein
MSILSLRHSRPAAATVEDARERWWTWNPARPKPAAAPVAVEEPASWWRWNPYRGSEAQDRRAGYAKGARDERRVMARRRRRGHPVFAFVILVAAVSGVGFLGLAYETGSFASGGAVIDQTLAQWRADLLGAASQAGDQGGHAVQRVGQSISSQSRQISS